MRIKDSILILEELKRILIKDLLESINDKYLFKAVFLAGGAGSGKGFVGSQMFKGTGAVFINSDQFFEFLLAKHDLPFDLDIDPETIAKQQALRGKAKQLRKKKSVFWLNGMLPIVLDGTSAKPPDVVKRKNNLENLGYDTAMVFVDTTLDVAMQRNMARKRKVADDVVKDLWNKANTAKAKYKSLFKTFIEVDNSKPLEGVELKKLGTELRKSAMKILKSPLKNSIGKKAIELVKASGKLYLSDIGVDVEKVGI